MVIFEGIFFLCLGMGLMALDFQALRTGWLPCGPNGLQGRLEFRRDENPSAFWFMFALYGAAGAGLVVFALRLFFGLSAPLPLS